MLSSSALIGDLIKRVDALLTGTAQSETSLGLASRIQPAAIGVSSFKEEESPLTSLAGGIVGGGAGLLASFFRSLFRRDNQEPLALPLYEKPEALFQEYDVATRMRPTSFVESSLVQDNLSPRNSSSLTRAEPTQSTVVIQVNALDAKSFTERSDAIASAVRLALSRNHSLRDEIWEE